MMAEDSENWKGLRVTNSKNSVQTFSRWWKHNVTAQNPLNEFLSVIKFYAYLNHLNFCPESNYEMKDSTP